MFDRFGFNLPENKKIEPISRELIEYRQWNYIPENYDWVDTENEQGISGFTLDAELYHILNNLIDTELE